MLYERAMEMKTEIVSFLKDYPSTIKGEILSLSFSLLE